MRSFEHWRERAEQLQLLILERARDGQLAEGDVKAGRRSLRVINAADKLARSAYKRAVAPVTAYNLIDKMQRTLAKGKRSRR